MKNRLAALCLSTLFAGLSAQAGNEGPQAAPVPPPPPAARAIAQVTEGSFFVPPGAVSSRIVSIREDGRITLETKTTSGKKANFDLGRLSPTVTKGLTQILTAIQPGPLVTPDSSQPECQDAPFISYRDVLNGRDIELEVNAGCITRSKVDETEEERQIVQILDAALTLSRMVP